MYVNVPVASLQSISSWVDLISVNNSLTVKMSPQKIMGAGISSLIEHMSYASKLKRLSLA